MYNTNGSPSLAGYVFGVAIGATFKSLSNYSIESKKIIFYTQYMELTTVSKNKNSKPCVKKYLGELLHFKTSVKSTERQAATGGWEWYACAVVNQLAIGFLSLFYFILDTLYFKVYLVSSYLSYYPPSCPRAFHRLGLFPINVLTPP